MIDYKRIKKSIELQRDYKDCGIVCLLSLVKYYHGSASLELLRESSGSNRQGTSMLGLLQAASKAGFKAQGYEASIDKLIQYGKPAILHVILENKWEHYIICFGYDSKLSKFIIHDPSKGIINLTKEELNAIWKSRACLTLTPSSEFITSKQISSHKKKWLIHILKDDKKVLVFSTIVGIFTSALGMVMAVFSQKLIDDILPSKDLNRLITGIVLVAFLLITRVAFTVLREYFLIIQAKDFNNRIIDRFFSSLIHLPKPFFDSRKIGELVARLNDTQRIQKVIKLIVGNFVIDILVVIVSFIFLFSYSWVTGVIALTCLPFYFVLVFRSNEKIINAQKNVMQGYARSESNFISTIQGIATIKNNNRQNTFQKLNQLVYGQYQKASFDLGKINLFLAMSSGVFGVIFLIIILTYNSFQVYNSTLLLGELMAILGISGNILPSITNLALITIPINEAKVAFNRMFEFSSIIKESKGEVGISKFNSLKIKDLTFRFAGRSPLLKQINLDVYKNEFVAIVGESGSGKSTLGQILQKFYSYEKGDIILNSDCSLKDTNTSDWRNTIGVIPQDITIFSGNIIDNVLLGSDKDPNEIVSFCKEYGFEKFIRQLPQGYNTIVGEEGINLSGGQKQILALIRALFKKPQLLIMDEATSAMDRRTEEFTLKLLSKLKNEMGILFISHRLQSLKHLADRIYVLENGIMEHAGNHDELMQSKNFYSEFWDQIKSHNLVLN